MANHPSEKLTPGSSLNMHVASRVYLSQTWDTPIATPHPNPLTPMVNDQKSRRCSKSKRDYKSQKCHFRQVACCGSEVFFYLLFLNNYKGERAPAARAARRRRAETGGARATADVAIYLPRVGQRQRLSHAHFGSALFGTW